MSNADDSDNKLALMDDVVYHPCEFCGSDQYDFGDCDPVERPDGKFDYRPKYCDFCAFGLVKGSKLSIH